MQIQLMILAQMGERMEGGGSEGSGEVLLLIPDDEVGQFGKQDVLELVDLLLEALPGKLGGGEVVLQHLVAVELGQVAAEAGQHLVHQLRLFVLRHLRVDAAQPQQPIPAHLLHLLPQPLGGFAAHGLESLRGAQGGQLEELAAEGEFLLDEGKPLLEVLAEERVSDLAALVEFGLALLLLLPARRFHARPQLLQALAHRLLARQAPVLALRQQQPGLQELHHDVRLVGHPQRFSHRLVVEPGERALQVLEEPTDRPAEGVLVHLPEEPPVRVLLHVLLERQAVPAVVAADGLDGGEVGGGRGGGGEGGGGGGVLEGGGEGGADEKDGELLPALVVVGGSEGVVGQVLAVGGSRVEAAAVVGDLVVDHADLQELHLEPQRFPLHLLEGAHLELAAVTALEGELLAAEEGAELVQRALPEALLVFLHQLLQLLVEVDFGAGRAGEQLLLLREGQLMQLQVPAQGRGEVGDEDALLEEEGGGVAGEAVEQRVLVGPRLLPVDVLEQPLLVQPHVLGPQRALRLPLCGPAVEHLPQRAPRLAHALLAPEEDQEVAVLLAGDGRLAQVGEREQLDAVVGFLVVVGEPLEPLHAFPARAEGEGEEDGGVALAVVLRHPGEALRRHLRARELPPQIAFEVELPQLVRPAVERDRADARVRGLLRLRQDGLVVPAEQSAEEGEVVGLAHGLVLLLRVDEPEERVGAEVEELATGGLLHLVGRQPLGQLPGELAVGPAHEAQVLVAVVLVLPLQLHQVVHRSPLAAGPLAAAREGDEEGVVDVVGGGAGPRDAGQQVAVVHADAREERVRAGERVHPPDALLPLAFVLEPLGGEDALHRLAELLVHAAALAAAERAAHLQLLGEAEAHVEGVALLGLAAQVCVLLLVPRVLELQPGEPAVELHIRLLLQLLARVCALLQENDVLELAVGQSRGLAQHQVDLLQFKVRLNFRRNCKSYRFFNLRFPYTQQGINE